VICRNPAHIPIKQFEATLREIAELPDEDNEWDGVEKFRYCREIAAMILKCSEGLLDEEL
jgi:hypothetical protein